ncbi:MAG: OmpA family protein [Pseudomonadota bacterium]|nr:OmpA family protein [Pseudomonadota bacterium]
MIITLMAAVAMSTGAFAQDGSTGQDTTFDFELFRPHADLYGYSATHGAATIGNLQLGVGAWFNYSNDPVVLMDAQGNRVSVSGAAAGEESGDGVIDSRLTSTFQVGMGITRFASLTVDVPLMIVNDGWSLNSADDPTASATPGGGGGIGDLVVTPKIAVLDRDYLPFGLAVIVPVGLPTGAQRDFLGEGGVTVSPMLAAEYSDGSIHSRAYKFRVALNGGYRLRGPARVRDMNVSNEILYAAALGYHPIDPLEITAEFHGASFGSRAAQNPAEALLGAKVLLGRWVAINVGGGTAVMGGIGAPDYRVFGGVTVAPSFDPNARDSDGDKLADGMDKCPKDSEDLDGYQDDDGCPELDNDADGREDKVDKCPDDPEDDDGYLDNDGCPDVDNDKDGIVDTADRCADEAETVNGFNDEDGCADDKPVEDSDGDTFKDDVDRCPYDAEDLNGFEDEDGCPDDRLKNARVVVTASSIKINDVIYFDTGKATIQDRSFDLLNELAGVITEHPELKKIRVEGHTDNKGDDLSNLKLSQARAESVAAYLKKQGIEGSRLDAAGFGEMRPIATNDSDDGRGQNRRVEFIIVDRD